MPMKKNKKYVKILCALDFTKSEIRAGSVLALQNKYLRH